MFLSSLYLSLELRICGDNPDLIQLILKEISPLNSSPLFLLPNCISAPVHRKPFQWSLHSFSHPPRSFLYLSVQSNLASSRNSSKTAPVEEISGFLGGATEGQATSCLFDLILSCQQHLVWYSITSFFKQNWLFHIVILVWLFFYFRGCKSIVILPN